MAATATRDFTASWERFFRITRRIRARAGRAELDGLSLSQYQLLEPLRTADELTVGELAESAGVAAPTATRMLDCLARDGLIERRHSEQDRRAVLVSLTAEGAATVERAHARAEEWRGRVFASLEPGEREQAARLLSRLADILERELP
jgi:DNA-binding MarR family transcriptional regulator